MEDGPSRDRSVWLSAPERRHEPRRVTRPGAPFMAPDAPTTRRVPDVGDRLAVDGHQVTVQMAVPDGDAGVRLAVQFSDGTAQVLTLDWAALAAAVMPANDGAGDSVRAITALWAKWMQWAIPRIRSAVLATTPLRPYAHQDEAVNGHMLVQPRMRMLLGDEPGTGKTIMTGMYLAEGRRGGLLPGLALIVVPAHLVRKWQRDLRRYFGIDAGHVTREVGRDPHDLRPDVDTWVVSIDLFTYNNDVRRKLSGEHASWSLAVFDEAHRLTPTAQYLGAASELADKAFHLLLLTATPHRGKEGFFRALFNLLDPNLYPWDATRQDYERPLRPSPLHYLRRMKESLRDHDGSELFPRRTAQVKKVNLTGLEQAAYDAVMSYVDDWYPDRSALARSIYGKRAASSLQAAHDTLNRRRDALASRSEDPGTGLPRGFERPDFAGANVDDDDAWEDAENVVVHIASRDRREELAAVDAVLARLRGILADYRPDPSRWQACKEIMREHGIAPRSGQLLVFTEFTDTARWLATRFAIDGFSVEVLEGSKSPDERDELQRRFLTGDFEVLVSTDAGGEGIDLQSAHVMLDWDIPWSLVRLEQRMGRLHRIGQRNDVFIYHLVAPETREGRVQAVMLENFASAAKALDGRIFDLMDATAAGLDFDYPAMLAAAQQSPASAERLISLVPTARELRAAAEQLAEQEDRIASPPPDLSAAHERLLADRIEAINPIMVEEFIRQIARAEGWDVRTGSAARLLRLTAPTVLPPELGGERSREVCADEAARRRAWEDGIITAREVMVLGPAEEAFTRLVERAADDNEADLRRGAAAVDAAALTDYLLMAFECRLTAQEGPRKRTRVVPILVRYSGREAFPVAWESVMQLEPREGQAPLPEPAARLSCEQAARRASKAERERRQAETDAWIATAKEDLEQVADEHRRQLRYQPEELRDGIPPTLPGRAGSSARSARLDEHGADQRPHSAWVGTRSRLGSLGRAGQRSGQREASDRLGRQRTPSARLRDRRPSDGRRGLRPVRAPSTHRSAAPRGSEGPERRPRTGHAGTHRVGASPAAGPGLLALCRDQLRDQCPSLRARAGSGRTLRGAPRDPAIPDSRPSSARGCAVMTDGGQPLINRWFPCAAVDDAVATPSGSGRSEKAIFTWFASRPIAQARAAVLCTLLPDSAELHSLVNDAVRRGRADTRDELAKRINAASDRDRVVVLDMFSGRGLIPLEAARLGLTAVGLDYSPVAVLGSRLLADYPLRDWSDEPPLPFDVDEQGQLSLDRPRLLRDAATMFAEIARRVRIDVADLYPVGPSGVIPWGYLWAVTMPCDGCGRNFPLIGSLALRHPYRRTDDRGQAYRIVTAGNEWRVEVFDGTPDSAPTLVSMKGRQGKSARCPFCRKPHDLDTIKAKGRAEQYKDAPLAVAEAGEGTQKVFRTLTEGERSVALAGDPAALAAIGHFQALPHERIPPGNVDTVRASAYGYATYGSLMNARQATQFAAVARAIFDCHHALLGASVSSEYATALSSYAGANLVRCLKHATRGAKLRSHGNPSGTAQNRVQIDHIYSGETKVAFSFDYFEAGIGEGPGTWTSLASTGLDALAKHIDAVSGRPARIRHGSALSLPFRDASIDAIVTDPPYHGLIDYGDASDLLYVWLKRALSEADPELFANQGVQDKSQELIVKRRPGTGPERALEHRTEDYYERSLRQAFSEAKRVLRSGGPFTVVFGHSDPDAWTRLLTALHDAGFVVAGAWPSRTESANTGVASIKVTVTIGCRVAAAKRPTAAAAQVDREAAEAVRQRVPQWERDGLALADQMMASYGPAMEVYGRYSKVLQPNGTVASIDRYLSIARRAVRDALKMKLDAIPLETFDAVTRLAVFWMRLYGRTLVPKGEARFLAQVDGLRIEDIRAGLLEESKGSYRLTLGPPDAVSEKSPVFDVVRAMVAAWVRGGTDAVAAVLDEADRSPDDEHLWAVVTDLSRHLPESDHDSIRLVAILRNVSTIKSQAGSLRTARIQHAAAANAQEQLDFSEQGIA